MIPAVGNPTHQLCRPAGLVDVCRSREQNRGVPELPQATPAQIWGSAASSAWTHLPLQTGRVLRDSQHISRWDSVETWVVCSILHIYVHGYLEVQATQNPMIAAGTTHVQAPFVPECRLGSSEA